LSLGGRKKDQISRKKDNKKCAQARYKPKQDLSTGKEVLSTGKEEKLSHTYLHLKSWVTCKSLEI